MDKSKEKQLLELCKQYDEVASGLIVLNMRLAENKITEKQFAIEQEELINMRIELANKLKELQESNDLEQENQKM